jgi:fluoride exporter
VAESAGTTVDPDVDLRRSTGRRVPRPRRWPVIAVISAGGMAGALARHGLTEAFAHSPDGFGWTTFGVNVSGCLLIGVLMVLVSEVWTGRRLLRPFLGIGVLGGFTTFSTYVLDFQQAIAAGAAGTALIYLATTMLGALTAVWVGATITGWALRRRTPAGRNRETSR